MPIVVASSGPFLDLDQVKDQLHITSTTSDAALTAYIDATQVVIEKHTGYLLALQSVQETVLVFDRTKHLRLDSKPVVSLDSLALVDGTVTYDVTGAVARSSGLVFLPFVVTGNVIAGYTAGLSTVPANYLQAGMIIVQHLWETRRGAMPSVVADLQDGLGFDTRLGLLAGYAIPRKALELLGSRAPVVA